MDNLLARFLRYVSVNTQSDPGSDTVPSTPGQMELAQLLAEELGEIGLSNVRLDERGYLMATLPGNPELPCIGFVAHMDTAPDYCGDRVKPQIIENYAGGDILLAGTGEQLSPTQFPVLSSYIGDTLVTTDGTTLLGGDDKAGIAAIVTAIETLKQTPLEKRPTVQVGFTPDEEIGRGADHFDVEAFAADWAYTVDGGELGEFEYESFNAASAFIEFRGNNVHPGTAKGILVNSQTLASQFVAAMPAAETPECTEGYEGFYHLVEMKGSVESTRLHYIIRDFDSNAFEVRKQFVRDKVSEFNAIAGGEVVTLEVKDSYFNMREPIEAHPESIEVALAALEASGISAKVRPIRGGTDGSRLSFMGLPCPNLFTGGHNFHGRHEFISVNSLQKSVQVICAICARVAAKKAK